MKTKLKKSNLIRVRAPKGFKFEIKKPYSGGWTYMYIINKKLTLKLVELVLNLMVNAAF